MIIFIPLWPYWLESEVNYIVIKESSSLRIIQWRGESGALSAKVLHDVIISISIEVNVIVVRI